MAQEQKDNTLIVFYNKDSRENIARPKYKGVANVSGKLVEVALWEKEDKNGNIYFTGMFKDKEPKDE